MARSVNKVILIGNLGQDPELRYTPGGTAVCNLRLATNESYKDNNGEWVEKTEWHSIVAWARLAEICGEYLKKGSRVYFEGSLQTRSWDDKDGNTRYSTEVKVRDMMMLDDRGSSGGGGGFSGGAQSGSQGGGYQQSQGGRSNGGGFGGNQGGGQRPAQSAPANDDFSFEPDDELPF